MLSTVKIRHIIFLFSKFFSFSALLFSNMELPSPMYLGAGGSDHSQLGYDPHLNGGLSLQEMIDSDIKADFDDVLQSNPLSFQVGFLNT